MAPAVARERGASRPSGRTHRRRSRAWCRLDGADLAGSAAWLRAQRPDVVFYPGRVHLGGRLRAGPGQGRAANLDQPLNLARAAAELGAAGSSTSRPTTSSTAVDGPYDEDADRTRCRVYGQVKHEAEEALADALGDRLLTARTSWVFGPERQGKNFAYQLVQTLPAGQAADLSPSDQVSSPSYGPDVARACVGWSRAGGRAWSTSPAPRCRLGRRSPARSPGAFGLDPGLIDGKTTAELGQGAPRRSTAALLTPRLDEAPRRDEPPWPKRSPTSAKVESGDGWANQMCNDGSRPRRPKETTGKRPCEVSRSS